MIAEKDNEALSPRIAAMKERLLSTRSAICTERARIYTEAYRNYDSQPVILKRAHALERTLAEMTIFIEEDGLLAGNQSSGIRAAPIFPEYVTSWIIAELDEFDRRPGDAFYVSENQKRELREICSWWEGKTLIE